MKRITKIEEKKPVLSKKRVAAYCRVSTGQDAQLLSLETQKAHYESWIRKNPEWEFAGLYYDEGISGTKKDTRPGLMRLMEDCGHGLIDHVVTKSISRFARNTTDSLEMVRKLLSLNISVFFEKENIDTGSMESELLLTIMSSLAESESVSISENRKWSDRNAFSDGTYKCSCAPYGYAWDKENARLVIDSEQAETVRFIFEQTLAGVGAADIAKELTRRGIPTKRNGRWAGYTVTGIIRNEKYTGACLFQKTYTDLSFNRHRNLGERDQYYMEDHHEAIVTKEIYDAANAVVDRRREEKGITSVTDKYHVRYPFSGKIICGECGGKMKRKTYVHLDKVVLACSTHINDKEACSMKFIGNSDMELAFMTVMNKLTFGHRRILKPFYEQLKGMSASEVLLKISGIDEQIEENNKKQQTIKTLFAQGLIAPALMTKGSNELAQERERLLAKKDSLEYSARSELTHIEETKKLLQYAEKGQMLTEFDGELFTEFVDTVLVKTRDEYVFRLKCGLELTERMV